MKTILDTTAYTALMRGEKQITKLLEEVEEILVPVVVLGELHGGFRLGRYLERNLHELELFLSKPGVFCIDITKAIAERYGILIRILKDQGTPIPTNDIWICAAALENGARVLTRDRHYGHVPGIVVIDF